LLVTAVAIAIALAVADSSVVVLALPDIYRTFDVSIVGVSWTITAYNLAIVVGALAVLPLERRVRGHVFAGAGFAVFALASLVCGAATSFPMLIAGRCGQGLGAALALAGSLPVMAGIRASDAHAVRVWAGAGTLGAALGPALGGFLTQLFSWRSIFWLQAPVAAFALFATLDRRARAVEVAPHPEPSIHRRVANAGLLLLYAALVGALFLSVLLLVVVWGWSPLAGALVVSTLPAGAVLVRRVPELPARLTAVTGGVALAGGLVALAFLPASRALWVAVALGACGIGLGLLGGSLGRAAVPSDDAGVRTATISIAARHAGFVVGLIVIAPVLAANMTTATHEATRATTAAILDAPINLHSKVSLALSMRDLVERAQRGEVPDISAPFNHLGSTAEHVRVTRETVASAIRDTITRYFRPAFLIAALFGAGAAVLVVLLPLGAVVRDRHATAFALAVLVLVGVLLTGELLAGARDYGTHTYVDPCHAPADPYPVGHGIDGSLQRIALSAINGAACKLGTSREDLVLSIDRKSGFGNNVHWTQGELEVALRAGLIRAIDDADHRDTLPAFAATGLKFLARHAPIDWVLGRINIPFLDS
jgi:MFS family permease